METPVALLPEGWDAAGRCMVEHVGSTRGEAWSDGDVWRPARAPVSDAVQSVAFSCPNVHHSPAPTSPLGMLLAQGAEIIHPDDLMHLTRSPPRRASTTMTPPKISQADFTSRSSPPAPTTPLGMSRIASSVTAGLPRSPPPAPTTPLGMSRIAPSVTAGLSRSSPRPPATAAAPPLGRSGTMPQDSFSVQESLFRVTHDDSSLVRSSVPTSMPRQEPVSGPGAPYAEWRSHALPLRGGHTESRYSRAAASPPPSRALRSPVPGEPEPPLRSVQHPSTAPASDVPTRAASPRRPSNPTDPPAAPDGDAEAARHLYDLRCDVRSLRDVVDEHGRQVVQLQDRFRQMADSPLAASMPRTPASSMYSSKAPTQPEHSQAVSHPRSPSFARDSRVTRARHPQDVGQPGDFEPEESYREPSRTRTESEHAEWFGRSMAPAKDRGVSADTDVTYVQFPDKRPFYANHSSSFAASGEQAAVNDDTMSNATLGTTCETPVFPGSAIEQSSELAAVTPPTALDGEASSPEASRRSRAQGLSMSMSSRRPKFNAASRGRSSRSAFYPGGMNEAGFEDCHSPPVTPQVKDHLSMNADRSASPHSMRSSPASSPRGRRSRVASVKSFASGRSICSSSERPSATEGAPQSQVGASRAFTSLPQSRATASVTSAQSAQSRGSRIPERRY